MVYSKKQLRGFLGKGGTDEVLNRLLEQLGYDPDLQEFPKEIKQPLLELHKGATLTKSTPRPQTESESSTPSGELPLAPEQVAGIKASVEKIADKVQGITDAVITKVVDEAIERSLEKLPTEIALAFQRKLDTPEGRHLLQRAEYQVRNTIDVHATSIAPPQLESTPDNEDKDPWNS